VTYRITPGACLHCGTLLERAGDRLACPTCRSCLVAMAEVERAMRAMQPPDQAAPPMTFTPLVDGFARPRPCPQCGAVMAPCMLVSIAVDRCHVHGVWFDHDELERVLLASAPSSPKDTIGPVGVVAGVLDVSGTLLQILGIFLP
jgi:hypothetical protein